MKLGMCSLKKNFSMNNNLLLRVLRGKILVYIPHLLNKRTHRPFIAIIIRLNSFNQIYLNSIFILIKRVKFRATNLEHFIPLFKIIRIDNYYSIESKCALK